MCSSSSGRRREQTFYHILDSRASQRNEKSKSVAAVGAKRGNFTWKHLTAWFRFIKPKRGSQAHATQTWPNQNEQTLTKCANAVPCDCKHAARTSFFWQRKCMKEGEREAGKKKTFDFWLELQMNAEWNSVFTRQVDRETVPQSWSRRHSFCCCWNEIFFPLLNFAAAHEMCLFDENVPRHAVGCWLSLVHHNRFSHTNIRNNSFYMLMFAKPNMYLTRTSKDVINAINMQRKWEADLFNFSMQPSVRLNAHSVNQTLTLLANRNTLKRCRVF